MSDRDHEFLEAFRGSSGFGGGLMRAAPQAPPEPLGTPLVLLSFESAVVPPTAAEVERELGLPEGAIDRTTGVVGLGEEAWSYSVRVHAAALRGRDPAELGQASERIRELRIADG